MNVKNLSFFDNNGYNLNFEWNDNLKIWEGNIYFPKVSVGLYANTNIYIMEKITDTGSDSESVENYYFPQKDDSNSSITFSWDILNKFVDEFFLFDFDIDYYSTNNFETSALEYTPNNGPELETLIVKRFEEYEVELDESFSKKALPLHIAFSSPEKYDATTFKRSLDMNYNGKKIAKITFFAETIEEDERLKVLNKNMGYNIKPKDTIIFKESDIKECYPNYELLNQKRKELMIEGHNIYPYIGSYKAIINVIKYFGYENLNIIEYWRNVDSTSENFGMIFPTSKYKLTNKETLNVSGNIIPLPNKNYRKLNNISLVYTINHIIDEYDELELPLVKEDFSFTMEEVMIKLFELRRKLNDEFMPASSRIVDIIGEGNYFGLEDVINNTILPPEEGYKQEKKGVHHPSIKIFPSEEIFTPHEKYILNSDSDSNSDSESIYYSYEENAPKDFKFPTCISYISENRRFIEYLTEKENESDFPDDNYYKISLNSTIQNANNVTINDTGDSENYDYPSSYTDNNSMKPYLVEDYLDFYKNVNEGYIEDTKFEPNYHNEEIDIKPSAKVILENTSFETVTFDKVLDTFENIDENMTFGNIDVNYYGFNEIFWTVSFSEDQVDEDLKNISIDKTYEKREFYQSNGGDVNTYNKIFVELPYSGYYDVTMTLSSQEKTIEYVFKKSIKIEQYNLDIRGFYYDARELPEDLKYDIDSYGISVGDIDETNEINEYKEFILRRLKDMTNSARNERIEDSDFDFDKNQSIPRYGIDSDSEEYVINESPFDTYYINTNWYLIDNFNFDIFTLEPELNLYNARYIKNGVDVKPYTWFLLGFDESNITSIKNPKWTLVNMTTKENVEHEGRYFTFLLKTEGDYRIDLELEDTNGNKYNVSRTIIIVDKTANHKLYTLFKNDYDAYMEYKNEINRKLYDEFSMLNKAIDENEES